MVGFFGGVFCFYTTQAVSVPSLVLIFTLELLIPRTKMEAFITTVRLSRNTSAYNNTAWLPTLVWHRSIPESGG